MTLVQAQAQLDAWLAANLALASNRSYTIQTGGSSRTLTRADSADVLAQIAYWERRVNRIQAATAGASGSASYAVADFSDQ